MGRKSNFTSYQFQLGASIAGTVTPVEVAFPCMLIPISIVIPSGIDGQNGGLEIGYMKEGDVAGALIPAGLGGKIFLWEAGSWIVKITRWGNVSGGANDAATLTFNAHPMMEPLRMGLYTVEPCSRKATTISVPVANTLTNLFTLADMLGTVAVKVLPTVNPMRFRWATSPAGVIYDTQIAVNVEKVFKGEELPLGELNAVTTGAGPDPCKITKYIR